MATGLVAGIDTPQLIYRIAIMPQFRRPVFGTLAYSYILMRYGCIFPLNETYHNNKPEMLRLPGCSCATSFFQRNHMFRCPLTPSSPLCPLTRVLRRQPHDHLYIFGDSVDIVLLKTGGLVAFRRDPCLGVMGIACIHRSRLFGNRISSGLPSCQGFLCIVVAGP